MANLLNDFLKTAPIKHKKGLLKCIDFLVDAGLIEMDKKQNKLFINLLILDHIFDKRFTQVYELPPGEVINFYHHYLYDKEYGPIIWIIKNQNKMPRKALADFLEGLYNYRNQKMYDLKLLNLKGNPEP